MTSAHRLRGAIVGCIIPFFLTLLSFVEARNMGNLKPDTPHAVTKPFFFVCHSFNKATDRCVEF